MSDKETRKAKGGDAAPKTDKGAGKAAAKGAGKAAKTGKGDTAPKAPREPEGPVPEPRLREVYNGTIRPALAKEFNYTNPMAIPRVSKVAINVGIAEAKTNIKLLDEAVDILGALSGQKAVVRRSRKAISNFKLREDQPIGASVTLRGRRMWEFLDRLFSLALPRVRDFRGVSEKAFDGRGSYTLGVKDQLIFPEVDYSKVTRTMGMNISIVTTAKTDPEARALLTALGMPFRKAR